MKLIPFVLQRVHIGWQYHVIYIRCRTYMSVKPITRNGIANLVLFHSHAMRKILLRGKREMTQHHC